jgi:dihydroxyacetone kinase
MKYAVEMGSSVIIYLQCFIKTDSGIQRAPARTHGVKNGGGGGHNATVVKFRGHQYINFGNRWF